MRGIAAALVVCACALAGGVSIRQRLRHIEVLEAWIQLLSQLERRLERESAELSALLTQDGILSAMLSGVRCGMAHLEKQSFSVLWQEELRRAELPMGVTERTLVCSLGNVLGQYDRQTQQEVLRQTEERLTELLRQAQAERQMQLRLCVVLSLSTGLMLALILY